MQGGIPRGSPTIGPFLPVDEYLAARYVHPIPRQGKTQLLRRTEMLRLEEGR